MEYADFEIFAVLLAGKLLHFFPVTHSDHRLHHGWFTTYLDTLLRISCTRKCTMQDNLILNAKKTFTISKPALILLVVSIVLTGILAVATVTNMNRSQKLMELSFLRQGKTLIHAFEAGTKTSMVFRNSTRNNPLKDLSVEVLKDKGIAYIRIIDENNSVIISEGNIPQSSLKTHPELNYSLDSPIFSINWTDNIFEISQRFQPMAKASNGMSMMRMHWKQWNLAVNPEGKMYISVGFYTNDYAETLQADMYHTIFMLVMLILLFLAGLYYLFLYQRMHTTHATLLNTQLYTNHVHESIPDSLLTLNQEGKIVSCNKNTERLLGYDSFNIVGKKIFDIFPACPIDVLTAKTNILEKDAHLQSQSGETVPVKITSAQLIDHENNRIGKVLVMRDVRVIRSMERQLEHSRRLAALGSMAAGIAHEVRNPLGTLRGLAHFFGSEDGASDACKKYSRFMIKEVDRLNQLVTELLQFGTPRDIETCVVNIENMVERITTLLKEDLTKKQITFTHHHDKNTKLFGDSDLLIQTLLNLLKNSIQASPEGGEIFLDIRDDGEKCHLSVSDSGLGMSEETKSKMFDPFYTTRNSGTGIGLAVCHRIIERHNGYFEIDSMVNVGTNVTVVLPHKEK